MSVVYQQLITELQAETYLDGGFDHFFGLAVNAGDAQNVTEVADLIDGVTMVEPGLSRIVGIDVENYR